MDSRPDSSLVEAALGGDADSFTELCRRYYPAMVAIAHSMVLDRHLAEDAAQQAFAKAVHQLSRLRNRDRFGQWMATICRNVANDIVRLRGKLEMVEDFSAITAAPRPDRMREAVREAIAELSASARELVYLRYYDGMSYEQIATVLGISQQAINGRLRRAKKKVAHYLRRHGYIEVQS